MHSTHSSAPPTHILYQLTYSTHSLAPPNQWFHPLTSSTHLFTPPTHLLHPLICSAHSVALPTCLLQQLICSVHSTHALAPPTFLLQPHICSTNSFAVPKYPHQHHLLTYSTHLFTSSTRLLYPVACTICTLIISTVCTHALICTIKSFALFAQFFPFNILLHQLISITQIPRPATAMHPSLSRYIYDAGAQHPSFVAS